MTECVPAVKQTPQGRTMTKPYTKATNPAELNTIPTHCQCCPGGMSPMNFSPDNGILNVLVRLPFHYLGLEPLLPRVLRAHLAEPEREIVERRRVAIKDFVDLVDEVLLVLVVVQKESLQIRRRAMGYTSSRSSVLNFRSISDWA